MDAVTPESSRAANPVMGESTVDRTTGCSRRLTASARASLPLPGAGEPQTLDVRRQTMATGRDNLLTKQVGEYLVAAEVCRRGFVATTFTGNVPHYDIIASNLTGRHRAIQVKAILGNSWQFDIRNFVDVQLDGKCQIIGQPIQAPYPDLICILVRLRKYGADEFYIMTWEDLQKIAVTHHREYLARHSGVRPKKYDSFHAAIRPEMIWEHRDKWGVLENGLQDDV